MISADLHALMVRRGSGKGALWGVYVGGRGGGLPLMVFVGQQFREGVAEMAFLLFIMSEASVGKT